ncbi:ribosome biogenesis GTPase Der [Patescibacteria group bacterium]|nr:ribosome biogenesis GTPase Der [Patescibacteria group bacterium]
MFNRLLGSFRAIVTDIHGTTRELLRDRSILRELEGVELIDSPGLDNFDQELPYIQTIIDDADILLFIVDGKKGMTAKEEKIHDMIMSSGKKERTIFVVNKLEGHLFDKKYTLALSDYYTLGYKEVVGIAAKHGENLDVLMEEVHTLAKKYSLREKKSSDNLEESVINIAIVGKPNAGKSSLLNYLAKAELAHVDEKPGTTLDYIVTDLTIGNQLFRMYDTAGIRRGARAVQLEKIAWEKTFKMIQFMKPMIIMMIDITESITHMDMKIIGDMIRFHVPIIIVLNKVDLVTAKELEQKQALIVKFLEMAKWIPIIPISAQNGKGVTQLFKFITKIHSEMGQRITTSQLNKVLGEAMVKNPPRFPKNKICRMYYASQVSAHPPRFVLFINSMAKTNFAYTRWVDNVLRRAF